jgi:pyruvate dehydrogenase (quinone)
MKAAGFVDTNVDLKNPDFAAMAQAMGIHARRVEDPGDLPAAMKEMLAHNGPGLLDVLTAKQELSMPPTITPEEIKGFSLWVVRAVMNGRGDEVIDLAKTNLLPRWVWRTPKARAAAWQAAAILASLAAANGI